jgi:hypothetical protein
MARTYLQPAPATRLVVEVDYVERRAPDAGALDHLATILRREARKPGGVEVRLDDSIPDTLRVYTSGDLDRLEERYRDARSSGDTATIWIVYLNGRLSEDEGALGVAYRASTAAILKDQIRDSAGALVSAAEIERSVLTHEAGHLLALINIGYRSASNHEDPQHPNHARSRGSVMYWAIEDISITVILEGAPPDDFDADDRADLAALREG